LEKVKRIVMDKVIFEDQLNAMEFKKGSFKGKYAILIPCYGSANALFFLSFTKLINRFNELGVDYKIIPEISTYIPWARETLSKEAFLEDCEWVLWFDADVVFEPNAILYLMQEIDKTPYDIVSPSIHTRMAPHFPMVYKGKEPVQLPKDQEWIKADAVGFGCVLMRNSTMQSIERPHFTAGVNDKQRLLGEDIYFFRQAKKAGLKLGVNLFVRFGHFGGVVWNEG
jgi:hypothetical protein